MSISERIYNASMRLYPDRFLLEHQAQLQQLFRDQLRDADTRAKRLHLWLGTIVDLFRSVPRIHMDNHRSSPDKRMSWIAYALCAISMLLLFRFTTNTDDAGIIAGLIVISTFVLGVMRPHRAWLWALLIGLSVPLGELLAGNVVPPLAGIPGILVLSAFVVVLGLAASYSGALVRRFMLRVHAE